MSRQHWQSQQQQALKRRPDFRCLHPVQEPLDPLSRVNTRLTWQGKDLLPVLRPLELVCKSIHLCADVRILSRPLCYFQVRLTLSLSHPLSLLESSGSNPIAATESPAEGIEQKTTTIAELASRANSAVVDHLRVLKSTMFANSRGLAS